MKGREPKGVLQQGEEYEEAREEIIQILENLKIDEERPIKSVKKREDIYWGTRIHEAPDLMVFFNPGWQAARHPEIDMTKKHGERYVIEKPRWSGGHDGTHDPTDVPGILAIFRPGIQGGKQIRTHLWDIAPTILSLMNIPIPKDMDGKPLPFF